MKKISKVTVNGVENFLEMYNSAYQAWQNTGKSNSCLSALMAIENDKILILPKDKNQVSGVLLSLKHLGNVWSRYKAASAEWRFYYVPQEVREVQYLGENVSIYDIPQNYPDWEP